MSDSVISMIFLGVLGVLFVLLVVLTIVLIVTRKKDSDEESYEDYEEEYEELEDEAVYDDSGEDYSDSGQEAYGDSGQEAYDDEDIDDESDSKEAYDDSQDYPDEPDDLEENDIDELTDENESKEDLDIAEAADTTEADNTSDTTDMTNVGMSDELGDYSDSAFAPYQEDDGLSNEEAIMASVKEAEAMSEAVIHGKNISETEALFGLSDELASYDKKKPTKKSNVSSNDDFYWYNKTDVAEKPSYKTKEMYYHYFNIPTDCIDDLLVEMYDCALVRTEEIRYIAYGIEPKAVSIKDILSEGNYYYKEQPKKKEPLPQDLIKIYEKWCGYVDKLFDKVEIHADEFTIQEIRRLLYEFGRNDVDVLIEGK